VEKAKTFDVDPVRKAVYGQTFAAPSGTIKMHEHNHHTYRPVLIGEILKDGQFKIISRTKGLVEPEPWSKYTSPDKGLRVARRGSGEPRTSNNSSRRFISFSIGGPGADQSQALVRARVLRPRLRLHEALGARDDLDWPSLRIRDEHGTVGVVVVLVHLDGAARAANVWP